MEYSRPAAHQRHGAAEQRRQTSVSQPFTISQPIALTIQPSTTEEINLAWNSIDGADRYEVLHLVGNDSWQVLAETTETSTALSYDDLNQRESWLSVRAVSADGNLRSQRAVAQRHVWINALPVAVDDYIARLIGEPTMSWNR